MANLVKSTKDTIASWYREYEFVTAVYLLEPWEKRIVNSVMAGIAVFTLYSAYNYLPHYANAALSLVGLSE